MVSDAEGMLISLRSWYNKRIRVIYRVAMHQVELCDITSVGLQRRIAIWDLGYDVDVVRSEMSYG